MKAKSLILFLLLAFYQHAQVKTIKGFCIDVKGKPIENVFIKANTKPIQSAYSDNDGMYLFNVNPSWQTIPCKFFVWAVRPVEAKQVFNRNFQTRTNHTLFWHQRGRDTQSTTKSISNYLRRPNCRKGIAEWCRIQVAATECANSCYFCREWRHFRCTKTRSSLQPSNRS